MARNKEPYNNLRHQMHVYSSLLIRKTEITPYGQLLPPKQIHKEECGPYSPNFRFSGQITRSTILYKIGHMMGIQ
jgi:hypothetical protein